MTESGTWVGASVFCINDSYGNCRPLCRPDGRSTFKTKDFISLRSALATIAISNAVLWWAGVREPLIYVAVNVIYGIGNGYALPAWQAYVADLVPRDFLMNAITLNSTQFNAARAIGPSVGGVVLAVLGPAWAFLGNGISFIVVFCTLLTLPRTSPSPLADRTDSQLSQFARVGHTQRHNPQL